MSLSSNVLPLEVLTGLLRPARRAETGRHRHPVVGVSGAPRHRLPAAVRTLLADRPAAGRRDTHLIVRLNIGESVRGLSYRHSIGAAAAAATERIVNALSSTASGLRVVGGRAGQPRFSSSSAAGLADAPERPTVDEQSGADRGVYPTHGVPAWPERRG